MSNTSGMIDGIYSYPTKQSRMMFLENQEEIRDGIVLTRIEGIKNMIVLRFVGEWNMDQLHQTMDYNKTSLNSADILIIDSTDERIHPNLGELYKGLVPILIRVRRKKCIVFFGQKGFAESFRISASIAAGIFTGAEVYREYSLEDALQTAEKFVKYTSEEES